MNQFAKRILENTALCTVLALTALMLLGPGMAGAQVTYLGDGAIPNAAGGWDLPAQGTCPADLTKTTRPECVALRLEHRSGELRRARPTAWTTSGVCNDTLAHDRGACNAKPDRLWNAGTGVCAIVMMDDDRNDVVCAMHKAPGSRPAPAPAPGSCRSAAPTTRRSSPPTRCSRPAPATSACAATTTSRSTTARACATPKRPSIMGHKNMSRKVTRPDALGRPAVRLHRLPGADHRRGLLPRRRRLGSDDLSRHRQRSELRLGERHGRHRPGRHRRIRAASTGSTPTGSPPIRAPSITTSPNTATTPGQAEGLLLLRPLPHHRLDGGRDAAGRQGAREVVPRHHLGRRHGRGRRPGEPRPRRALHREDGLLGRLRHLLRPLPQLGGRQVGRRL